MVADFDIFKKTEITFVLENDVIRFS